MSQPSHQPSDIIKRGGARPTEPFSPDKLERSIIATCRSVRCPDGEAAQIAADVTSYVARWLKNRPKVTSDDIRRKAAQRLAVLHEDAAYLYKHRPEAL